MAEVERELARMCEAEREVIETEREMSGAEQEWPRMYKAEEEMNEIERG